MQVTERRAEGLKRELEVVVPAATLGEKLDAYLDDMRAKVRINGFRPGKVPVSYLRKMYGKAAMAEILQDVVAESVRSAVEERDEKPALQPDVDLDRERVDQVVAGDADLAFTMTYEVMPEIEVGSFETITIEKPVATVPDEDVEEELAGLAKRNAPFSAKDGPAAQGDRIRIGFVGRIDGDPFEGGSGEGVELVLGSGQFIPGFEDQLMGVTAGEARDVAITFPEDYQAEHLAGKEAVFAVTVEEVAAPEEAVADDALAERLGLESLEKLKDAIRGQLQQSLDQASRQRVKRQLLDALDERYQFDLPETLVENEFRGLWDQMRLEMERAGRSFEDEGTTEEAAREEYRKIAHRRVKLGLVLSEVGEKAEVQVPEEAVQRALYERVRQFPGQEQAVIEFYRKNPQAIAALRAPIFEEKVVDYILELVTIDERPVTPEELMKELQDDGDHDHEHHHHHHDHDHHHDHHHHHDHGPEAENSEATDRG